jgi:hypothetical protein
MLTKYDKAITAFLIPLLILANQKWGVALPADPETVGALVAAITAAAVYLVPNKGA